MKRINHERTFAPSDDFHKKLSALLHEHNLHAIMLLVDNTGAIFPVVRIGTQERESVVDTVGEAGLSMYWISRQPRLKFVALADKDDGGDDKKVA